jgi:predicted PurR-regulated permease PerM
LRKIGAIGKIKLEDMDSNMNLEQPQNTPSPHWSNNTKLVATLTLIAIIAGLVIQFQSMLAPLLVTCVLAYLVYPTADFLRKKTPLSWRVSVAILFLLIAVIVIGLLTWGGIMIINQLQSLVIFLQGTISDLPTFLSELSQRTFQLGPFQFSMQNLFVSGFSSQILSAAQSLFAQLGIVLGGVATGAASTIAWVFFILWLAYFIVVESEGEPEKLLSVKIPGYSEDFRRIRHELKRIWNAFLRGQLIIFAITTVIYIIILGTLGVHFYFGLAMLAGLARFLPYVGPLVTWTAYGLVAYFQGTTIFGLSPFGYVILIVGIAWVTDAILDNLVVPRLLADSLKIHPALIMVAVLIGLNLLGLIGVILAAPVTATAKLAADYIFRKLLDQDPWEGMRTIPPPLPLSFYIQWAKNRFLILKHLLKI